MRFYYAIDGFVKSVFQAIFKCTMFCATQKLEVTTNFVFLVNNFFSDAETQFQSLEMV